MSVSNWEVARRYVIPGEPPKGSPKGKTHANAKLTALTGLLIFVLLAIEGVTIPFIGPLFTVHAFIGWVLLPPILLKMASTSYRFVMYYIGNPRYSKAGPPKPLLRILAPLIVVSTTLLMWSGIEMVLTGPGSPNVRLWSVIHKGSFIIWFGLMTIHVLAYFMKAGSLALPELNRRPGAHSVRISGRTARIVLVSGSLIIGLLLGLFEWHLAAPWVTLFRGHLKIH
ncbi:MAG: hypothetical protein M0Z96_04255 [Actinomycetota bacterium]|nr:hypothetical protein [Actinomycetota bacterium]